MILAVAGCGRSTQKKYRFLMPSANGLKDRASIMFRGVQVGYITDIHVDSATPATPVVATAFLTDPGMRLLNGDTGRVGLSGLLGDKYIEIVRSSDTASGELAPGAAVQVSVGSSMLDGVTDFLDALSGFTRLPPEKQKQVAGQIRSIINAAAAENTGVTPAPGAH